MSFFVADNKIPITQTSVGIPSTNGLSYNPGQQIEFHIDPQVVKFFNPKDSALQFNVKLQMPGDVSGEKLRMILDNDIGAQSLIREIRIWDGNNNALLEEIVGYNVATMCKYTYDQNESLRNKRALTEGCGVRKAPHGQLGTAWSYQNSAMNQFSVDPPDTDWTHELTNASYLDCKVCIPLNTGIFSNDKVFPCMLTNGLRISILLEDSNKVCRMLEGAMLNRKTTLNPFIHSQNASLTEASGSWSKDTNHTTIYLTQDNGYTETDVLPFCVGETISIYKTDGTPAEVLFNGDYPKITAIEYATTPKLLKLTTTSFSLTASLSTNANASHVIYSRSADEGTPYNTTYVISDVELNLQIVDMGSGYEADMMTRMKSGGTINYDFLSMTNYRYSQLAGDIVANIQLPIENRRMKSIICIPTDSSVYTNTQILTASGTYQEELSASGITSHEGGNFKLYQDAPGLRGISDYITSYQFLYAGRLQPSRLVECSKTSSKRGVSQQHLIELEKALSGANITGQSLLDFNTNFVIGRAVAVQNGIYDGRNRQFSLQVNYQGTTAPTKNKLWNNFVYHIRRLTIKGDSISVEV